MPKTGFPHINFAFLNKALLGVLILGALIIFVLLAFPARIIYTQQTSQEIDKPFTFKVLGFFSTTKIETELSPYIAGQVKISKGWNPFVQKVEVIPNDLFFPNTDYTLKVGLKSSLGIKDSKLLNFKTTPLPKVLSSNTTNVEEVKPTTPIIFKLNKVLDKGELSLTSEPNFEYTLNKNGDLITIIPSEKLEQGQDYKIALNLEVESIGALSLFETSFSVIDPLEVESVTPAANSETISKNSTVTFIFKKEVNQESWSDAFTIDPLTDGLIEWTDPKTVIFTPNSPFNTSTKYSVTLKETLAGKDGSSLTETQIFPFTTAGLVTVKTISPSSSYAALNSSITVEFDQPVEKLSAQNAFSISPSLSGSYSWAGNSMIFKPNSLSLLTTYSVKIALGVKSLGGEDSNKEFSGTFTTTGEKTKIIGKSVQGRSITAYYFGGGPKKILLIGTLHGSESNTGNMLNQWLGYIRANQNLIPEDKTFIIIPFANPDGRARNTRFNASNVDLNRNWGTPDWQALSYWQGNSYPQGGGSGPFSEPETAALRDLIISENPSITVTYHSAANMVIGNGISDSFGDWYANLTGYNRINDTGEHDEGSCVSALGYCITGTMEEWMSLRGLKVIVVEFISSTSNEYSRNLPALKGLLIYPL